MLVRKKKKIFINIFKFGRFFFDSGDRQETSIIGRLLKGLGDLDHMNVGFNTFYEFLYIQAHDLGIWAQFVSPQFPKYTKTGLTQPLDCLYL